jgi:hypothetical protein
MAWARQILEQRGLEVESEGDRCARVSWAFGGGRAIGEGRLKTWKNASTR